MSAWRFELLGYSVSVARPGYLLLTLVAVALFVVALLAAVRRRDRLARLAVPTHAARLAPGVSVFRPAAQALCYGLGLLLLGVGLTQPQCGSTKILAKRRGIDVVVALDASKSMLARDVEPSRLDRARAELNALLDNLKGDRVGLVVFAGEAFVQCPLTSDYGAVKMFLRAVDPEVMPQGGSNLGAALSIARDLFENADRGAKDKVVVLLSDGEDLAGEVDQGLEALKETGIRVYAVGIGSEQGEPIPVYNRRGEPVGYKKDEAGNVVLTRLDRAGLTRIAAETGGDFFHQPRGVAMGEVAARIDRLQKSELESRITIRYEERFQVFALPGLVLLVLGMLLLPSRRPS